MSYSLKEINYRTVADPKGLIEECDYAYQKKVERAADLISKPAEQPHRAFERAERQRQDHHGHEN